MEDSKKAQADPHYGHALRIFGVVGLIVAVGLTVRALLVPDTFGQYGRYRGAAVAEELQRKPRHVGEKRCAECHEKVAKVHGKDAHGTVACEACHGAGWKHVQSEGAQKPQVTRGKALCLRCHQRLAARPSAFPQIDVGAHFRMLGVRDPKTDCVQCHSPHEPLFMDKDLRTARLHPVIHRCRDCHPGRADERMARPATHPAIFQCDYCHKKRVADFQKRKHHKLRCTTCHIFRKESEFAGRIVRDADPRFCLLCHRKSAFRGKGAPPLIDPKKHVEEPGTSCLECHSDAIHGEVPRTAPPRPAPPRSGGDAPAGRPDSARKGGEPGADSARPGAGMAGPEATPRPAQRPGPAMQAPRPAAARPKGGSR